MINRQIVSKATVILVLCSYIFFYKLIGGAQAAPYLIIDKSDFTLQVCEQNLIVREYPIAIGKNPGEKTCIGDMKTPTGSFFVDAVVDSLTWTHDFNDGKGEVPGAYGPYFISLGTAWEGIGIHGTHAPESIGTRASEGCIRMYNEDLRELKTQHIYIGMSVIIRE